MDDGQRTLQVLGEKRGKLGLAGAAKKCALEWTYNDTHTNAQSKIRKRGHNKKC